MPLYVMLSHVSWPSLGVRIAVACGNEERDETRCRLPCNVGTGQVLSTKRGGH
jgi:hypothetical protein